MIHSRPGYAPRRSDQVVAKLNDDMIPAIHRSSPAAGSALKEGELDARTASVIEERNQAAAKAYAERLAKGPEVIVNPVPSATPQVNKPGK